MVNVTYIDGRVKFEVCASVAGYVDCGHADVPKRGAVPLAIEARRESNVSIDYAYISRYMRYRVVAKPTHKDRHS